MNKLNDPLLTECPECLGKLTPKEVTRTLVGYGGYKPPHDHDDNCCIAYYNCENGHLVVERQQNFCPVDGCDWIGKTECFCSKIGIQVWDSKQQAFIKLAQR